MTWYFATVSVLLVITILLQQKNSSLGSMMGGDAGEEMAQARRGSEKILYRATIILGVLLLGGALYAMYAAAHLA